MIKVSIKAPSGLVGLTAAVQSALPEIAQAVRNDIITFAGKELRSSLLEYRTAVQVENFAVSASALTGGSTSQFAVISLSGWLANAVESGWEGGDMVRALVNGRSGRTAKDGSKYATIRFRHTKPGTTGAVGTVMGRPESRLGGASTAEASRIGKAIARRAAQLSPNSGRLTRRQATNAGAMTLRGSAAGAASHSGPIYEGMGKRKDSAGTTYETYRRVSEKVKGKWLHPGITERGFFPRAARRIPLHANSVIKLFVGGLS